MDLELWCNLYIYILLIYNDTTFFYQFYFILKKYLFMIINSYVLFMFINAKAKNIV